MAVIDSTMLSKIISHALRHEPWLYELELDDEGWVPVSQLLEALRSEREEWHDLNELVIAEMISASSRRRHEMAGGRIRASYGHSFPGKLKRIASPPPVILFHGTSPDVIAEIEGGGLNPMKRQYVHLSVDEATAIEVGKRKSKTPKLLLVRSLEAFERGVAFYEGNNKVWLAAEVPPQFIDF